MLPLVLYDIPSRLPGNIWSPNPTKPRFVLGYKNLPFDTVYLEYPDIAPKLKEIGASPTSKRPDGSDYYTLPVVSDPNTGAIISDSWDIAEYLDKTYPEKVVFPKGSKGLIKAFDAAVGALQGVMISERFVILRSQQSLNERSQEYFSTTRGEMMGEVKLDEWSPEGPKRDAHWEIIEKKLLGSVKVWYEKAEGKWAMGDTFSYADVIIAARLFWFKRVFQDHEWKRVASLHDGKWEKLLGDVEKECNFVLRVD